MSVAPASSDTNGSLSRQHSINIPTSKSSDSVNASSYKRVNPIIITHNNTGNSNSNTATSKTQTSPILRPIITAQQVLRNDTFTYVKPINFLLIAFPVSVGLYITSLYPSWQFITAAIAIIPAAGWLGNATEQLSEKVGPGLGGLLNATFGNAAELIISLFAMYKGEDDLVKASLVGSILGNLLLVLGCAILAGGFKYSVQTFNKNAAGVSSNMTVVAAVAFLVPEIFDITSTKSFEPPQLSLCIAIIMFCAYICLLVFQLRTHRQYMEAETDDIQFNQHDIERNNNNNEKTSLLTNVNGKLTYDSVNGDNNNSSSTNSRRNSSINDIGGIEDEDRWTIKKSLSVLGVATLIVAVLSEVLSSSVSLFGESVGLSNVFIGVIIVAIVGNAAEHSTAIMMAMQDNMNVAISIAFGSALQIAMFVMPIIIFFSYGRDGKPLDMLLSDFEVFGIAVAAILSWIVVQDGGSNYLEGIMLLVIYLILAVGFWFA